LNFEYPAQVQNLDKKGYGGVKEKKQSTEAGQGENQSCNRNKTEKTDTSVKKLREKKIPTGEEPLKQSEVLFDHEEDGPRAGMK